jgi:hypothetical protein
VSTSHGVCQTFNSLTSSEIYKDLPNLSVWKSVFEPNKTNSSLVYPKGFGSAKGMYIILNSYESIGMQQQSNDFILSITNQYNAYDIVRQSFNLLPGNAYTFRVMASQVSILQSSYGDCMKNFSLLHKK